MNDKSGFWDDAEIVSTYTRAQAIEDGVLVDLRQGDLEEVVQNAGLKYPVACTAEVFAECVNLTGAAKRAGNDMKGRLWDVLWMLKMAIRRAQRSTDRISFTVRIVRDRVRPTPTELVAVCGPGDNAEPSITIMFPGQN